MLFGLELECELLESRDDVLYLPSIQMSSTGLGK